jgi:hypothetical protein
VNASEEPVTFLPATASIGNCGRQETKVIGRKVSWSPIQTPRPLCRMHGAAVLVAQVAMPVHSSPLARGDLNPPLTPPRHSKPFSQSR